MSNDPLHQLLVTLSGFEESSLIEELKIEILTLIANTPDPTEELLHSTGDLILSDLPIIGCKQPILRALEEKCFMKLSFQKYLKFVPEFFEQIASNNFMLSINNVLINILGRKYIASWSTRFIKEYEKDLSLKLH